MIWDWCFKLIKTSPFFQNLVGVTCFGNRLAFFVSNTLLVCLLCLFCSLFMFSFSIVLHYQFMAKWRVCNSIRIEELLSYRNCTFFEKSISKNRYERSAALLADEKKGHGSQKEGLYMPGALKIIKDIEFPEFCNAIILSATPSTAGFAVVVVSCWLGCFADFTGF